jgi:hypothetical protein
MTSPESVIDRSVRSYPIVYWLTELYAFDRAPLRRARSRRCIGVTENQIKHGSHMYIKVGIVEKRVLHMSFVQLSVHLSPWTLRKVHVNMCTINQTNKSAHPYSSTLRPVQDLELTSRFVYRRIELKNQI